MIDLLDAPRFITDKPDNVKLQESYGVQAKPNTLWTEDELHVLTTGYWGTPMAKLLQLLPRRSENAIRVKAVTLQLKRDPALKATGAGKRWTAADLKTLASVFPSNATTQEVLDALPGRTWGAITCEAARQGLARKVHLSAEELNTLLDIHTLGRKEVMRRIPSFSWLFLRRKAKECGLHYNVLPDKDLDLVWEMFTKGYSKQETAAVLDIDIRTVGRGLKYLKTKYEYKDS